MNGHPLIEMSHMLHGINPSIVNSKSRLGKTTRELGLSILRTKGDLDWRKALIIASFPMLLGNELSLCLLLCFSTLSKCEDAEKDSLGRVLDLGL